MHKELGNPTDPTSNASDSPIRKATSKSRSIQGTSLSAFLCSRRALGPVEWWPEPRAAHWRPCTIKSLHYINLLIASSYIAFVSQYKPERGVQGCHLFFLHVIINSVGESKGDLSMPNMCRYYDIRTHAYCPFTQLGAAYISITDSIERKVYIVLYLKNVRTCSFFV